MIELRSTSKKFGEICALDNVNLIIEQGKIFTVIGPNGSGKTTLLRIIAGIEKPTSGKLLYQGKEIGLGDLTEFRKNCTLVFQKASLFNTTVEKNVAYGLAVRGYSQAEIGTRIRGALDMVRLSNYEKRWAKKLSGGEQQRVSLARALVLNTPILLLDEPTANLDPKNISIIEETILRVSRERGVTVIFATHNMFQAEAIGKQTGLIINGTIVRTGSFQDIFQKPSDYLASFARLENVFSGNSKLLSEGISVIDLGQNLQIIASARKIGPVTVFVRPEDIILSKNQIVSSARNSIEGSIRGTSILGDIVKIQIDIGRVFVVKITRKSFQEMNLNIGSKVFLTFKATAVRLL